VALKESTVQIEHLKTSTKRLAESVDAQGQGNERTAMTVASMRAEIKDGAERSRSNTDKKKDGGARGAKSDCGGRVTDVKPFDKREAAKAVAMELALDKEAKASQLRRPVRPAVKHLFATTVVSRDVLMDPDTAAAVINAEAVKEFAILADEAHSYLMNHIYFPSSSKRAAPVLKRPLTVISSTVPHTVAQFREYVLKPYFKVLGFSYNPLPVAKANKWYKQDRFLTSCKGEKADVAAAKSVFTKIGGRARIVKNKDAGGRSHVDMVVGHHALIGAFVKNEFEIALGKRQRGRNGNGSGSYMHWVAEFVASVSHLSKNYKNKNVHAGFRIMDAIDPAIVAPLANGRWMFTAPTDNSSADVAPVSVPPKSVRRHRARTSTSELRACSVPGLGGAPAAVTRNCADDYGVGGDDDGRVSGQSAFPPPSNVVIDVDDDTNHLAGAAMIGLKEGGGVSDGGSSAGSDSDTTDGSADVGGSHSSSDYGDSDDAMTALATTKTERVLVGMPRTTRRNRRTDGVVCSAHTR